MTEQNGQRPFRVTAEDLPILPVTDEMRARAVPLEKALEMHEAVVAQLAEARRDAPRR